MAEINFDEPENIMENAIYKEFTVNGKTEGHWVDDFVETEYDSNGNKIHSKD